jgi:formiminoglutamate deiminase
MSAVGAGRYHCDLAVIGGTVQTSVSIEVLDGRFTSITQGSAPAPGATRLPGLTLPGLANAHSHAFHRALRSRTQAGGGTFWTWRDVMYRAAARLQPDSYHRLARATFAEMALAGVTCVGEFHYLHHHTDGVRYNDPNAMGEALLAAAAEAGIRITLLDTVYLHGGLGDVPSKSGSTHNGSTHNGGYLPTNDAQLRFSDGSVDRWVERVDDLRVNHPSTQRVGAAVHSVRAVDPRAITAVAAWAAAAGAPLHAHVSEQTAENEACLAHHGVTPVAVFSEAGALAPRFSAVHATHLNETDIALLAAAGATVAMCPTTERDLGDGIGPTHRFGAEGIAMSLGTDSHASIDLLEEARALELNERLRSHRRGNHAASDLLEMASRNGHRSLGWDDAGTMVVGARADLVTLALDSVRTAGAPTHSAVEVAMFAASAADVTHVVVDGRVVVADGRHATIDVPAELQASIAGLFE